MGNEIGPPMSEIEIDSQFARACKILYLCMFKSLCDDYKRFLCGQSHDDESEDSEEETNKNSEEID